MPIRFFSHIPPHLKLISVLFFFLFLSFKPNPAYAQTIKSAAEHGYPPFSIKAENGTADGFSVELLTATLKAVDLEVSFYVDSWNQVKQDLAEGKIQVLPLVGRTPERETIYDFTFPYLTFYGAVFIRDNTTDIHSVEDLKHKQVAVMKGDNAEEYVKRESISQNIVSLSSYQDAFQQLSQGQYDAVIAQKMLGHQLLTKLDIKNIVSLESRLEQFKQEFTFAVKEGDQDLLELLNEGLSQVMTDGTFNTLYTKWFQDPSTQMDNLSHAQTDPTNSITTSTLYLYLFALILIILLTLNIDLVKRGIKIRSMLFFGFGIVVYITIGISVLSIHSLNTVTQNTQNLYSHPYTVSSAVHRVNSNIIRIHRSMKDIVLAHSNQSINLILENIDQHEQAIYQDIQIIKANFLGDQVLIDKLEELFSDWKPIRQEVVDLMKQDKVNQAAAITKGKGAVHVYKLETLSQEFVDFAQDRANQFYLDSNQEASDSTLQLYLFTSLSIMLSIILLLSIASKISQPIKALIKNVHELEKGNLDIKVGIQDKHEIGELSRAFDRLIASLKESRANTEKKIKERTLQLEKTIKLITNRELKMIDLKNQLSKSKQSSQD